MASQNVPDGFSTRITSAVHLPAPIEIMLALQGVVIFVVLIADIERRIGKGKIDRAVGDFLQALDAVFVMYVVPA